MRIEIGKIIRTFQESDNPVLHIDGTTLYFRGKKATEDDLFDHFIISEKEDLLMIKAEIERELEHAV